MYILSTERKTELVQFRLHARFVHNYNECLTFIQDVWWPSDTYGYYEDGNIQTVRIWRVFPPEAVDKRSLHSPKLAIVSTLN